MNKRLQQIVAVLAAILVATGVAWGAASYPTTIWTVPVRASGDIIGPQFFNDPNNEIIAIETDLINGTRLSLKPLTTNTFDLETSLLLWRSEYLATTLFGTQGTTTANSPFLNLTSTWNAGAVTFQGILENVTCTACAAASTLIDLQKAGVSQFKVDNAGNMTVLGTSTFTGVLVAPVTVLNSGAVTVVPLTLKAVASQTGDLLDLQNSASNLIFQFTSLALMVDGMQFNSANTGGTPSLVAIGTDAVVGLTIQTKGLTGALSLIAGSSANLVFTAGAYQFTASNPALIRDVNNNNLLALQQVTSSVNYLQVSPAATGGSPTILGVGTDATVSVVLGSKSTGSVSLLPGNLAGAGVIVSGVALAVDGITVTPSATGGTPSILATGTDAVIPFLIGSKSTGSISLLPGNLAGAGVIVSGVALAVDGITITPSATGNPATVTIAFTGTDANGNLNLVSKGTGTVQANGATIVAAPTITIKKGTGLGNYSTLSTTYVRVDTTNLVYAVTVPVGQKVLIAASVAMTNSTGVWGVALADGTADNTGILVEQTASSNSAILPATISWVFVGDGALHTFNLQFKTTAGTVAMSNSPATLVPVMTFWLGVAN